MQVPLFYCVPFRVEAFLYDMWLSKLLKKKREFLRERVQSHDYSGFLNCD